MGNARILVVEDEPVVALDIQMSLKRAGYQVPFTVGSGEESIERVEAAQPDLVLMDIQLEGEMDGIKAARHIWERLQVPVVYLTANSDRATFDRAVGGAPFGYVVEPFDERTLHATIEVALKQFQEQHEALESAEEEMEHRTQELTAMIGAFEEHLARWDTAAGIGREVSVKVAVMVNAVTDVVKAVQSRAPALPAANGGAGAAGTDPPLVEEVSTLVSAMTEVINVVRLRLVPTLETPTR